MTNNIQKIKQRTYGTGLSLRREDKTLCIESIWNKFYNYQCSRKRGYGKQGLYCKQHSKKDDK